MKIEITKYRTDNNSGFTLVELSIVIVIIGLIIAGVTGGQALVNQARLRNIVTEIQTYDTAIKNFKAKFRYYPGDLPTAQNFWGAYNAGPPITGTANGNGNWQIDIGSGEDLRSWRQLTLAGFLPGTYTGAGAAFNPGQNCPKSAIAGGGYQTLFDAPIYNTTGNAIQFGSITDNTGGFLNGAILSPRDASSIDSKMDDGLAASGTFYAARSIANDAVATRCTSGAFADATGVYLLDDNTISCRIFWWLDNNR